MYNANDKTLYNWSPCLLTESELSKLDPRLVHVLAYQRLQQLITQTTSKVRLFVVKLSDCERLAPISPRAKMKSYM